VNYGYNWNQPRPMFNTGYNFNDLANQFSLNLLKLGMSHSPDPVGFEFDLGFGETMNLINATARATTGFNAGASNGDEWDKFIEQAYVEWKPARGKGFELDFGKFVTFAGAEVIESYSNWNYSRSLLFTNAIPYDHTGLRLTWPMGKHIVGGFQVVNGWNNTIDDNSGKTIGPNVTVTYSKWAWAADYYGGPENPGTNKGWRQLFDTTLTLTPTSKVSAYINYDYVQNRNVNGTGSATTNLAAGRGIAGALHIAPSKWSFTPRVEWWDPGSIAGSKEFHQYEFTFTTEYKMLEGLMWRGEYRYDWSNMPIFQRGGNDVISDQSTATIALIAFFGPKR